MELELFRVADRRQRFDDGGIQNDASEAIDYEIKFESEDPVEFVDADMARPSWALVRNCAFGYEPEAREVGEHVLAGNLDRLTRLRVEGVLDDPLLERLTTLRFPSLTSLVLRGCDSCSPTAVASLAQTDFFPRLQQLSLPDMHPDGLNALLQTIESGGGTLNGLTSLDVGPRTVGQLQHADRIGLGRLRQIGGLDAEATEWLSRQEGLRDQLKAMNCLALDPAETTGGDRVIRALCSDGFSQLEEIDLSFEALEEPTSLRELGHSGFASTLTRLNLQGCPLGDAGWTGLAESGFANLCELHLSHTEATPVGAERLFQSSLVSRLRRLGTDFVRLDAESYALFSQNLAPEVEELEVSPHGDCRDAIRHLFSADRFERLRRLQVVSYSGNAQLDFEWFPRKVRESLHCLFFGYGDISASQSNLKFPKLQSLKLAGTLSNQFVWDVILNCDQLQDLQLSNCGDIPPDRVRQITQAEFAKSLINLEFGSSTIGDRGAEELAAADMAPVGLWLGDSGLSKEGARKILESKISKRLNFLSLEEEPGEVSSLPKHCYLVVI